MGVCCCCKRFRGLAQLLHRKFRRNAYHRAVASCLPDMHATLPSAVRAGVVGTLAEFVQGVAAANSKEGRFACAALRELAFRYPPTVSSERWSVRGSRGTRRVNADPAHPHLRCGCGPSGGGIGASVRVGMAGARVTAPLVMSFCIATVCGSRGTSFWRGGPAALARHDWPPRSCSRRFAPHAHAIPHSALATAFARCVRTATSRALRYLRGTVLADLSLAAIVRCHRNCPT